MVRVIYVQMNGTGAYEYWVYFDNIFVSHTPKKLYGKYGIYESDLQGSKCYDEYFLSDKNNMNAKDELGVKGTGFEYDEIMLFKIEKASNVVKRFTATHLE